MNTKKNRVMVINLIEVNWENGTSQSSESQSKPTVHCSHITIAYCIMGKINPSKLNKNVCKEAIERKNP